MTRESDSQWTMAMTSGAGGDRAALSQRVEALYDAVRRMSAAEMHKAFPGRSPESLTLAPTVIADDAMMRILRQRAEITDDGQFFCLASRFIRQLVVDYRRQRRTLRRGGGAARVELNALLDAGNEPAASDVDDGDVDSERVQAAIERLENEYPRKAEVVTLHVVCGHSMSKVAEMVGVSLATAERDWAFARAWLADALRCTR